MHSNIVALLKKELKQFTLDEQIKIINFKINELENMRRRTGSSE